MSRRSKILALCCGSQSMKEHDLSDPDEPSLDCLAAGGQNCRCEVQC